MKYCNSCEQYDDGNCKLKGFKVSVNATFCKDYKVSSEIRRKEVIEWMLDKNFIDPETDKIPFSDVVILMILWGDKVLSETKNKLQL